MNFRKLIICAAALLALALIFTSCAELPQNFADKNNGGTGGGSNDEINIIATTFPQYDWLRRIIGNNNENIKLTLLTKSGVDMHSFQPTVDDIAAISVSDMFVYVGGASDAWVEKALENAANKDIVSISMVEVLGDAVKEEEIIEGMEHDHSHGHGEIHPEDVQDRPLSDWQGEWQSVEIALESGFMDEYIAHQSGSGQDITAAKEGYAQRWKSDYAYLSIDGGSVSFGGVPLPYSYIGYLIVQGDHGSSVWYGFEAQGGGAPKYIAFSDHEIESPHDHDGDHDHDHAPHFHLRYGDESFEALTRIENWSPTFFEKEAFGEDMASAMEDHGHSHDHDHELDEHVWLSLKNAQTICNYMAEALAGLDADNSDVYLKNSADYIAELAALDDEYQNAVSSASVKTLLFGDRFPFRYLMDDYGIDYFAAFPGCSAETEASFDTIAFLAGKTDELNLNCVLAIDGSDQSIARTIVQSSSAKDQSILVMDSMQSMSASTIDSGATYLSIMQGNLEVLKQALSSE
ncbi:MAG: metal ABC transporter solute-binding protein, Zn/Mn family [Christensenellales bacterium]|jgi:zinc transport system substrate-binding protein